jgi:hypothetical protein
METVPVIPIANQVEEYRDTRNIDRTNIPLAVLKPFDNRKNFLAIDTAQMETIHNSHRLKD